MRYALAIAALLFAPFIIELIPKDTQNVLANLTMVTLCLTGLGLTLWVGLRK
jgi:hypothetical protein